jgi:pyruvate formate lyase activating enzyme
MSTVQIAGFNKTTLIDYTSKIAATIFLAGCNFRCPFCHNPSLLGSFSTTEMLPEGSVLEELHKRCGFIDGVCVSGGEPTLQSALPDFLQRLRALSLSIKLDTNGSRPEVLRALIKDGLVDYVAMDFKTTPVKYQALSGSKDAEISARIAESMNILISSAPEFEFRTTVVPGVHEEADILEMAEFLGKKMSGRPEKIWYLQQFVPDHALDQQLSSRSPFTLTELEQMSLKAGKLVKTILRADFIDGRTDSM